jgi:hypothetical protein
MKNLTLFLFIIFTFFEASAQNWRPINTGEVYNYYNDSGNVYISIWIDSSKVINSDTVFYLNKVLKKIDTTLINNDYANLYLINQPQFLLSEFIFSNSGDLVFRDKKKAKTYLIKTQASTNDTWIFDSTNNIQAQVTQENEMSIFGNIDSVKTILLSSNKEIVISKNHGIIYFPLFNTNSFFVNLVGIEGRNIGLVLPKSDDFFNFKIGDIFYNKQYDYDRWGQLLTHSKIVITNKQIENDTFIYHYSLKSRKIAMDNNYNMYDNDTEYVFSENNVVKYPQIPFLNRTNGEISELPQQGERYKPISVSFNNTFHAIIKGLPRNPFCANGNTDTIYECNNPYYCSFYYIEQHYGKGLGLTYYSYYYYNYPYGSSYYKKLIGYTKDGQSYGTILSDTFFGLVDSNSDFNIFPNPVINTVSIDIPNVNSKSELKVFDTLGKLVFNTKINKNHYILNMYSWTSGIYFFRFKNEDGVITKRIIKL